MVKVSNIVENGVPVGELGAGEADWHSGMSFVETPPAAALLRAIEVPPEGGDTSFLNMCTAWETLPADLRAAVEGRSIKHDAVYASPSKQQPGTVAPESGDIRDIAGPVHPIVRTHPKTGRKALFLGKRFNAYVVGMEVTEGEALLDRLWAHALNPEFIWTQQWLVGDLLMWDNRCTMHRRDAFDPGSRGLLYRTVLKGERPF